MEEAIIRAFYDGSPLPDCGGYESVVRTPYGESPLPKKKGYERIHKRTRDEDWLWFYRLGPEPIFDWRTNVKFWNARQEQWDVYPYGPHPPESNVNVIFEDLRDKLTMFHETPENIMVQFGIIRTIGPN